MTKRTEQKDLFLAALRGDAKAQRACTSAGKPCGGRCIPKNWNCRIKGEGQTPPTRGNKVQLSAEQQQQIKKARQSRRIQAIGTVAAVAGGAAAIAALSAKNPQKARRLFKKGPGVAGALGVGGVIPGPTRKVALGGNLGLAGAHAAGAMGANFGQNKRGRRLYAQHFARLKSLEKQVNKLEPRHIRLSGKVSEAKRLVDAANNQLKNKGTSKYSLNNATRSIAQQDRIRKQNVKSAYGSLRRANANLNAFEAETGFRKVKSDYTRTLKATTKIKSILLKPYKTKDVVGGVLNDYRASYLKGYNYARRQIRGIGVAQARRGPKANNVPFYARPELQADSAEEHQRADKKCGNSGIPEKAKCTKGAGSAAAPQKPGPESAGFIAKHKKHGGYSPSFFKSLNKSERAEFKALNEYAGSKKGRRERELQAIGGIAKGVAKIAAVGAVGGYGTAKALQALNRAGKGRSKLSSSRSRARKASYIEAKMEIMRNKGTGKYGARPRRKTGGSFRPDIEAIQGDAEGKKYSKTVTDPKTGRKRTVKYGAKGYTIAPGTKRGNSYCARSFGDMKSHNKNCAGKDRNTPLCLSRAKWKCSGKASRKDAGEKRLGKPCGNSHIPKRHNCSKDGAKDQGINKKAVAATVIAGAVGALAVGVALDARTLKKGFGIPPTPGFGSSMKKIMKEKGVDIQEASSIYYDRVVGKEGWKTGELVYTRSGKSADFSHYAIYMGKKDGVHTFAQMGADGIAATSGGIQETKYGPGVKAGDRGAAIFARPPKEYRAKKTLSGDEIAKRIDALKGKPLKYEAFSDNCETWARMIVGDGSRSLQAKKLTLTTKTAIRGVYKGLGKVAKEWGDGDDFPVVNGPVLSARKMARMLDSQDPVGNVGAFESLVDRSRRDAITSKHIGLITADALLTENMSAIEAVARVKRYLILLSAITVDMNK